MTELRDQIQLQIIKFTMMRSCLPTAVLTVEVQETMIPTTKHQTMILNYHIVDGKNKALISSTMCIPFQKQNS